MAQPNPQQNANLTSGHLLARNTLWNLFGNGAPMVVAAVAIPILIRAMGKDRFGVLSMALIVVGYFSLFDLGIGRALTKLVADKVGAGQEDEVPPLAWTALFLMLVLGIAGGVVIAAISPWLIHRALKIPAALQNETLYSFYLLALSIPTVTITSGLRGILEAKQCFRVLNIIRIPMSAFSFAGPLLVLPFSHSLVAVIGVLLGGRVAACIVHQIACFQALPGLRHELVLDRALITPLLKFGGWMMVSNLVGPIIFYVDRFFIGAALSLGVVAYYTVPFDLVNRFIFIPGAISGVLFPAFAISNAQDPKRSGVLLNRGVKYTFLVMFPLTLGIFCLGPEIFRLWLGASFAEHSSVVLRWLAVGILINGVTIIPFSLLQGIGRHSLVGKVLLLELAVYSGAAWILISRFGIEGAAIAWVGRATVEAVIFFVLGYRLMPRNTISFRAVGISAAVIVPMLVASFFIPGIFFRSVFLVLGLAVFAFAGWRWLFTPEERMYAGRSFGPSRGNMGAVIPRSLSVEHGD
jgi:O-antigen/teichoic acid export membrane protein